MESGATDVHLIMGCHKSNNDQASSTETNNDLFASALLGMQAALERLNENQDCINENQDRVTERLESIDNKVNNIDKKVDTIIGVDQNLSTIQTANSCAGASAALREMSSVSEIVGKNQNFEADDDKPTEEQQELHFVPPSPTANRDTTTNFG